MAVSVLAAAATQTSSLGIFTLFNLSHERLPPPFPSSDFSCHKASQTGSVSAPAGSSNSPAASSAPIRIDRAPQANNNHNASSNFSSLSSSPRQFPTDLTHSILEEGDETESEPTNEPVTPVSGRQSRDFSTLANPDVHIDADQDVATFSPERAAAAAPGKPTLAIDTAVEAATAATPKKTAPQEQAGSTVPATPVPPTPSAADDTTPTVPLSRRSTRTSISKFSMSSVSSFFKRSNSQTDKAAVNGIAPLTAASEVNDQNGRRKPPTRRWSMNKSSTTTRSNTPPSPGTPPLEMAIKSKEQPSRPTVPNSDIFFAEKKKNKSRASTGFSLRPRAPKNLNSRNRSPLRRRASSFDYAKQGKTAPAADNEEGMARILWPMPAETGTGVKARRMSLSLPDDFTVDVVELSDEYEFYHKFLGRHGKHIGKGATSKVTLMVRKGSPGELYAVKEFRGKSSSETREEYEKKIKSEYTVAKSLHHPNIVETVRLCTDHGRWNHVMEYCQEGDLFSLVNKGFFKPEDREKDRQCLFKQLVQGINYLHSNGIAHRDIKLENLLMTSDSKLKITDFGVSEVFSGIHPGLREAGGFCGKGMGEIRRCAPGICGSEPYIAPEVLKKSGDYDPRALDVWSSAIVMIMLIYGAPLWHRAECQPGSHYNLLHVGWTKWKSRHAEGEPVTESDYPRVSPFDLYIKPPALRRLLLQMLDPDPDRRISISDVVKNRWVKGIECCQLESYDDPSRTIDASKMASLRSGGSKTYCHNHLPSQHHGTHSLGKMPGTPGY